MASKLEQTMATILDGIPIEYVREYKFHPVRRWRLDFFLPSHQTGIEVEGGIFVNGRHGRSSGITADAEKYNEATILGIKILRFTTKDLAASNRENVKETILRLVG